MDDLVKKNEEDQASLAATAILLREKRRDQVEAFLDCALEAPEKATGAKLRMLMKALDMYMDAIKIDRNVGQQQQAQQVIIVQDREDADIIQGKSMEVKEDEDD